MYFLLIGERGARGFLTGESKTPLCDISVNIGSTKRGWDYYNRYLHI